MASRVLVLIATVSLLAFVSCGTGEKAPDQTPGQVTSPGIADQEPGIDDVIQADEFPTPTKTVNPKYPEEARKSGLEATIWLKVLVNKEGRVVKTVVSQPTEATAPLEQAAVDAIRQWTFKPATARNQPVSIWVSIPVKFKLADKK
jgi:TonB family protein